jgi:chromosome segregation ATPase
MDKISICGILVSSKQVRKSDERSYSMDKADLILSELKGINKRLDRVEVNQDRHEQMITQLLQIVAATNGKVSVLQKDVAMLKEDVAMLKEDVAMLKEDVAVLKEDVVVLKEDVAVLKEEVSDLKALGIKLIEGEQRQDRILEALSVRSLEQESKMNELRRAM